MSDQAIADMLRVLAAELKRRGWKLTVRAWYRAGEDAASTCPACGRNPQERDSGICTACRLSRMIDAYERESELGGLGRAYDAARYRRSARKARDRGEAS